MTKWDYVEELEIEESGGQFEVSGVPDLSVMHIRLLHFRTEDSASITPIDILVQSEEDGKRIEVTRHEVGFPKGVKLWVRGDE